MNLNPSQDILDMWKKALEYKQRAYAPYSRYTVGVALRVLNDDKTAGVVFGGCNVENSVNGGSVCAEQIAIFKAVSEGYKNFKDLVLVVNESSDGTPVAPCAICRQIIAEFCGPEFEIWSGSASGLKNHFKFSDLLPFPFGPKYLPKK